MPPRIRRDTSASSDDAARAEAEAQAQPEIVAYTIDNDPDDPDGAGRVHYGSRTSPQVVDGLAAGTVHLVEVDDSGKVRPLSDREAETRAGTPVERTGNDSDTGRTG